MLQIMPMASYTLADKNVDGRTGLSTKGTERMLAVFVVTKPFAAGVALISILVPVLLLRALAATPRADEAPAAARRRQGLGALVIGSDGRASTSKVQVVLWTFAVFFAIAFLMVWGRSYGCGDAQARALPRCVSAAEARVAFGNFVGRDLQLEYFVLLGMPVTAAVAAKAIASAQGPKPALAPEEGDGGFLQSLREIVSNDAGETDLLDFQYFAFNVLTLVFFFTQFLNRPAAGLPDLPPTLIALSGLSSASYVTKKALSASTAGQAPPGA
jgi:hypothetical protein